ncbi:hypothetical protein DRP44_02205 [candidate division TA06 bacterium]|uniref:Ferritin-like diiron domain-containing protein n=1 Tax=candidate division TA06 bacterium TaxID=2250710 RepID=A0A660SA74_UNCT6|nr:MAG: hypothetical protein DRP44_02205 [candidate division TA06 bacterium]
MKNFTPDEILEFAVRIEENGEYTYSKFAEKFEKEGNDELAEFFDNLAKQEVEHKNTFIKMMGDRKTIDFESLNPEYYDYLKAYIYDIIFPTDQLDKKIKGIKNMNDALQMAIRSELDSIMFYMDMKNIVPESFSEKIDRIIDEERLHYLLLKGKVI